MSPESDQEGIKGTARPGRVEVIHAGRFLDLVQRGNWEFVRRSRATGVVAIIPEHDDGRLVFVEQFRPPLHAYVLELPAGLAGDTDEHESKLTAARRELEEETGYEAREWSELTSAFSSPGLTDEEVTFFHARGLTRVSQGGGVDSEVITVHEIHPRDLAARFETLRSEGRVIDLKLLAGLHLAGRGSA